MPWWSHDWSTTLRAVLWSVVALLATVSALCRVAPRMRQQLARQLVAWRRRWLQRRPRRVVIVGLSHSGKSTLLGWMQSWLHHGVCKGHGRGGGPKQRAWTAEDDRPPTRSSVRHSRGVELYARLCFYGAQPPVMGTAAAATAAGPHAHDDTSPAATQWDVREFDADVYDRAPEHERMWRRWVAHADAVVWMEDARAAPHRLAQSAQALADLRTAWLAARLQQARDRGRLWCVVRWLARWLLWLLFGIGSGGGGRPRFGDAPPVPAAAEWPPLLVLVNKIDCLHITPADNTTTAGGGAATWRATASPDARVLPPDDPRVCDTLYSPVVGAVTRALRVSLDSDVRHRFLALTDGGGGGGVGGDRKRPAASDDERSSGRWAWFPLPKELRGVVADFVCDGDCLPWCGPVHSTYCVAEPRRPSPAGVGPYAPLVDWSWLWRRMGRRLVRAAACDLVESDAADADTDTGTGTDTRAV